MNGYRFYLEYPTPADKRAKRNAMGTVLAVHNSAVPFKSGTGGGYWAKECVGAVTDERNSDCCGTSASLDYLRLNCRRISAELARSIHPKMFAYLK